MTTAGWLIMIASVSGVLALTGFCMWRVLTLKPAEVAELNAPLEIDTGDTADAD
jgi:hypothetical protein